MFIKIVCQISAIIPFSVYIFRFCENPLASSHRADLHFKNGIGSSWSFHFPLARAGAQLKAGQFLSQQAWALYNNINSMDANYRNGKICPKPSSKRKFYQISTEFSMEYTYIKMQLTDCPQILQLKSPVSAFAAALDNDENELQALAEAKMKDFENFTNLADSCIFSSLKQIDSGSTQF